MSNASKVNRAWAVKDVERGQLVVDPYTGSVVFSAREVAREVCRSLNLDGNLKVVHVGVQERLNAPRA